MADQLRQLQPLPGAAMKRLITIAFTLGVCAAIDVLPATAQNPSHALRVLSSQRIGNSPGGITQGFGSVWAADPLRAAVDRISVRTGRLQATIHTGDAPVFVTAGRGAIWASNTYNASGTAPGTTVVRISPRGDRLTRRIDVGASPAQLTITDSTLWVALTGRAAVARVQLPSGRVRITPTEVPAGPRNPDLQWVQGPIGVAVAHGAAWVDSNGVDALFRVSASTGRLTNAVPAAQACGRMYAYGDTIWASGECSPVIWSINARTGRVRTINLGHIPGPGLIGDVIQARHSAWITTDAGQLLQLSPRSGRVTGHYRLPSHLGAGSLTYAAGSLWTSDFGDLDNGHGRVVRLPLP